MLLPLAVFTADNEQIITVTLDLFVQACKKASLSLANAAWYVLHARSPDRVDAPAAMQSAEILGSLHYNIISISAN